ncbi:MAG: right-handed parallel beta-helix repeat-containing protein [Thermoplasmata archaeon]|nr:right-handed parallel beta-helix repeat-containing protein [Thermoplasmata archaeon]
MSDFSKKFLAIIIGLLLLVVFSSGCLDQEKEDKAIHDSDGDGYEDEIDVFPDDANEWVDTDSDGVGNNNDTDDDNDGMPDEWELKYGFDPVNKTDADCDFDNDNCSNIEEYQDKTDPLNSTDNGKLGNGSYGEAKLTLRMNKTTQFIDETIELNFIFENVGETKIRLVNPRIIIYIVIHDSNGNVVYDCSKGLGVCIYSNDSLIVMYPGNNVTKLVNSLPYSYGIYSPGEYIIKGKYELFGYIHNATLPVWKGYVESNEKTLKILKNNSEKKIIKYEWIVDSEENYYDTTIELRENLTILKNGCLNFKDVTLIVNNYYYGGHFGTINVNGTFNIADSIVTSINKTIEIIVYDYDMKPFNISVRYAYNFHFNENSNGKIEDSVIEYCNDDGSYGLKISSNNVVIKNCTIRYGYKGIGCYQSSPEISNNKIYNNDFEGIYIYFGAPIILNNEIVNNMFGISAWVDTPSPRIENNNISSNKYWGIYCWAMSGAPASFSIIKNNYIFNNSIGIKCREGASPTITNNIISYNREDGILCWYHSSPVISDNLIVNNDGNGISLGGYCNPVIVKNNISNNKDGILCCSYYDSYNDIYENCNPSITNNIIIDNLFLAINNSQESFTIDAGNNYWGSIIEIEISQMMYGNVDYVPWLETKP